MKNINKIAFAMGLSSFASLTLVAAPFITVQVPTPIISVQAPAPVVTVEAAVPDTYTWDGVEYVGVVGTQYYYLGPDKVWVPLDSVRIARFHDWERIHTDWRDHAIRNELYRRDVHGHEVPFHDQHIQQDVRHDDRDMRHDARDVNHDMNQDARDTRHDARDVNHDMNQDARDTRHDVRDTSKDAHDKSQDNQNNQTQNNGHDKDH